MNVSEVWKPTVPPTSNDRLLDLGFGLGGSLLVVMLVLFSGLTAPALVGILLVAPLALRRTSPLLMLIGCTVGAVIQLIVLPLPLPTVLAVPIVLYSCGRWAPQPQARAAVFIGLVGSVLGPIRWSGGSPDLSILLMSGVCAAMVITPYVLGRRRADNDQRDRDRQDVEQETLRMRLAESEQRARMAEVNERQRIARELHDIVAHSLSVIVVQSEGAKALATKRPEQAAETLGTISEISREALNEMRRLMGVLRNGTETGPADFAPASGLAQIPAMVAKTSERAEYAQRGEIPRRAGQTLGLTAYRLVQEALTNFLKHAGPQARAQVLLDYSHSEQVRVQVMDDGRGATALTDGLGNGLQGMFERVHVLGGTLIAQPKLGGGFLVRAVLPLPPAPAPPSRAPSTRAPSTRQPAPSATQGRPPGDNPYRSGPAGAAATHIIPVRGPQP